MSDYIGPSALLGLTVEIRTIIFQFAVVDDKPLKAFLQLQYIQKSHHAEDSQARNQYRIQPSQPALAATNTQIRSEVIPIFFGLNIFCFDIGDIDLNIIETWSKAMQQQSQNASLIKSVQLDFMIGRQVPGAEPARSAGYEPTPASIGLRCNKQNETPVFVLGESFSDDCTCVLHQAWEAFRQSPSYSGQETESTLLGFAAGLEDAEVYSLKAIDQFPSPQEPETCGKCGLCWKLFSVYGHVGKGLLSRIRIKDGTFKWQSARTVRSVSQET